jgi:uncharacterized protein YqhQ
MSRWRKYLGYLAALQLLPALESGEETLVGGQAVMEGVMMRSPHAWGIAVRKPNGEVVTHSEGLDRLSEKHKWMGWPFVRGVATLGQAMTLGYRALQFSANIALEEEQKDVEPTKKKVEFSGWLAAANIVLSLAFFIAVYKFIPWYATTYLAKHTAAVNNHWTMGLVDGVIRIALFLFFIWAVSRMKDIHRVFQFHGAEHKTVFAFESGKPVDIPAAQSFPTWHPRCGTSFLMTVMLISIPIYMFMPKMNFAQGFALRILMLPVIAGVSYEIIRFAARKRSSLFALMTKPGLWLQRITTQPCDDAQVDCAIKALDCAFEVEKQRGGQLVLA